MDKLSFKKGVYSNHIRFESTIREEINSDFTFEELKSIIQTAFQKGNGNWKGPIHFNIPINEPLYVTIEIEKPDSGRYPIKSEVYELSNSEELLIEEIWKN